MGKSTRGSKEYSREQKLVHENKRLKREIAQLRKQIARIDLDRFDFFKEVMEEHCEVEKPQTGAEILENLKKTWSCKECGQGHLEIILYTRRDGTHYYRKCVNCDHRTKSKAYSPEVKGIIKKSNENM